MSKTSRVNPSTYSYISKLWRVTSERREKIVEKCSFLLFPVLYFRQLESSMSSYHIINELNDLGMNWSIVKKRSEHVTFRI